VKQGQPKKRNGAEKQANSFLAKGEGFSICSFLLPTNWNLLFRQTFFIFCVWLKTVRGQSPSLFLVKHKKIPRRVLIL
jgi:hypothetical protein